MRRLIPLLLIVAFIAAGCGGADSGEGTTSTAGPSTSSAATTATLTTTTTNTTTVSSTSSSTSSTLPSATAAPTSTTGGTLAPVSELPGGLFCRDLAARGFGYEAAAEYWIREGRPDRMDADRNGVPCETVYPESDVQAYWEPPFVVIQASDTEPGDGFGHDIALSEGRLVVASLADVYVFEPSEDADWIETRLVPRNGVQDQTYPRGVAADENHVSVGALRHNVAEADFRGERGVVYLFTNVDGDWVEDRIEIDLVVADEDFEVAAMDGDRIVVRSGRGDLVVLDRDENGWSQRRLPTTVLSTGCPECPVDISGDTIALGHPWGLPTFIFTWDGTDWTEEQRPEGCGAMFGSSLDIEVIAESGEGFGEEAKLSGDMIFTIHAGSVWMYRREDGAWTGTSNQLRIDQIDALAVDDQRCAVSHSGGLHKAGVVYLLEMASIHARR